MDSPEYENMRLTSVQKTAYDADLKYKRDEARKLLRRGRNDDLNNIQSWLADGYANGTLQEKVTAAEREFGYRRHQGVALLLNM